MSQLIKLLFFTLLTPLIGFTQNNNEFYILDKDIGVSVHCDLNNHFMKLTLSRSINGEWVVYQTIDSLGCGLGSKTPIYEDFNFDGTKDLKVFYGTGARGSNEFHYIFIQDTSTNVFTVLKRAMGIPNLVTNSEKMILQSIGLSGSTHFSDYIVEQDSLVLIGGVDVSLKNNWTKRVHYSIDKSSNRIIIRTDSVEDNGQGMFLRK